MSDSLDSLFFLVDEFVQRLEDEGHPYEVILQVLRDYVEISDEYMLK